MPACKGVGASIQACDTNCTGGSNEILGFQKQAAEWDVGPASGSIKRMAQEMHRELWQPCFTTFHNSLTRLKGVLALQGLGSLWKGQHLNTEELAVGEG